MRPDNSHWHGARAVQGVSLVAEEHRRIAKVIGLNTIRVKVLASYFHVFEMCIV